MRWMTWRATSGRPYHGRHLRVDDDFRAEGGALLLRAVLRESGWDGEMVWCKV